MSDLPNMPLDNKERYLAAIAGQNVDLPEPADRKDMYLKYIAENGGGGGGGTSDYNDLTNKPQINGISLTGDKSSADLGIVTMWEGTQAEYDELTPAQKIYDYYNIVEDEDEEEPANSASLQSLSPLSLDRNALSLDDDFDTMDYPEEEVSDYADFDE